MSREPLRGARMYRAQSPKRMPTIPRHLFNAQISSAPDCNACLGIRLHRMANSDQRRDMNAASPISRLQLEHFKAFREAQDIPLRPITLLYGPNSSGKSSILQAVLLIAHALQNDSIHDACIRAAPGAPDLGGLKNFSHGNDLDKPVTISLRLEGGEWSGLKPAPPEETGYSNENRQGKPESQLLVGANDVFDCVFKIRHGFSFHLNGKLLIAFGGHESDSLVGGDRESEFPDGRTFPPENQPFRRYDQKLSCFGDESNFDHEVVRNWIAQRFKARTGKALSARLWSSVCKGSNHNFETRAWMYGILPFTVSSDNFYVPGKPMWGESEDHPLSDHLRLIFSLFEEFVFRLIQAVRLRLNDIVAGPIYLGPLRSYTGRRALNLSSAADSLSAGGDFTSAALIGNPDTLERVNEWMEHRLGLSTPYRLVLRRFFDSEKARKDFNRRLKAILDGSESRLCDLHSLYERSGVLLEVSLADVRSGVLLSQRDVGVGISQVLPILVAALGTWRRWHLIEQPELHLHPAHQAELADLFIESALGEHKNRFLIETHSEHLLLRIMKRIREQANGTADPKAPAITHEDVSVLYVEPSANGSIVRQMKLNARGELVSDWPGGFFEEGLRELLM